MRLASLFCAFLIAGCGAVAPQRPISSVGQAISSAGAENLKGTGINTNTTAEATPSTARTKALEIIEITVDPESRSDMRKLVPYLLGIGNEWQLVGLTKHPDGKKTWRWLHLGIDGPHIRQLDPFQDWDKARPFTPRKPFKKR